jgi:hypothetical protein
VLFCCVHSISVYAAYSSSAYSAHSAFVASAYSAWAETQQCHRSTNAHGLGGGAEWGGGRRSKNNIPVGALCIFHIGIRGIFIIGILGILGICVVGIPCMGRDAATPSEHHKHRYQKRTRVGTVWWWGGGWGIPRTTHNMSPYGALENPEQRQC